MGRTIGIDLGTTYSAIAAVNDLGQAEILLNREGERITPSVVLLQDDMTMVGTQAKRSAPTAPDDVVQFVKRQMGEPAWRFIASSGEEYTSEQISAFILKRLKEDAELALGEDVTEAVVTVPAYFDDARRTATKHAGVIAGLTVPHVLNEPTAAALSFGLDTDFSGTVLVFDLGGGTFDATLLRISDEFFDVIATDGNRNLGGFDWDNALMKIVDDAVQSEGGPSLLDAGALEADLRDKAETAKRTLSNLPQARIFVSADGRNHNISISRDQFEDATSHLVSTAEAIADGVLSDGGSSWQEIDQVLLVGGSTRMPMVRELVERLFGRAPSMAVNPDEAVALGAAIRGHLFGLEQAEGSGDLLPELAGGKLPTISDVTSQGLGVVARNPSNGRMENTILIPHNSKVPTFPPHRDLFSTIDDNQTFLQLQVTEGDETDLDYVQIIHEEPISIPPYPAGSPIEVVMSYDIDGTIHVEVIDLTAQKTLGEVELDRPSNLDAEQVAEHRRDMERKQVD
ncbi:MAG: Hsp70 family protein [Sulfitobacter sp.]|nr:Hsp70 family protein [Sulfitobacter sp.]